MSRTLLVKYADAGDTYVSWRWLDALAAPRVARVPAATVAHLAEHVAAALPDPRPGESALDALNRAAGTGPLTSPEGTVEFGAALGRALFPLELVAELQRADRLRLQPSPLLAAVPWPLLRVGREATPLLDFAVLEHSVPAATAASARERNPEENGGEGRVAVIDPRVPGEPADGPLGSVLGRPVVDHPLAALLRRPGLAPRASTYPELARRRDQTLDWLRTACAGAAQLLYVGHVTGGGAHDLSGARLHLADTDGTGRHRPIPVAELLERGLRVPPKCAFLGCGSGADLRRAEAFGVTLAAVLCGAREVVSCAWTLPTDAGLQAVGAHPAGARPLAELVLAVAAGLDADDTAAAIRRWQCDCQRRWLAGADGAVPPLLWASVLVTTREAGNGSGGGVEPPTTPPPL